MFNFLRRKKERVFVGLSGGVDSAVSALLLQHQGYSVVGVFIKIQIKGYPCPAANDRRDAMRVAAALDIPFLEIDLSKEYEERVLTVALKEFASGRTPNPDTLCNREIKFGLFFDWCRAQGAAYVATGHYAQTKNGELYMSADGSKDQSYFLSLLPEEVLTHTLFPIGHLHKPQVRALAKKYALPNAARPDSQGLCFLGDVSLKDMLEREVAPRPGAVLSETGEHIGTHDGVELYTLGQRHGFTLYAHTPHTRAHFVIAKDKEHNTITVSESKFPRSARATRVEVADMNWIGSRAADGSELQVRYRYRQQLIPATVQKTGPSAGSGGVACVVLHEPHYVPLGQSLVLYQGERCLGGGTIKSATLTQ